MKRKSLIVFALIAMLLGTEQLFFNKDTLPDEVAQVLVPNVEASCAVILNADYFQEDDSEETELLTLIITTPEGVPIPGVCITFTRDLGPGARPEIIGSCTTDDEGRCTIESPGGPIGVFFGNTRIGGIPVTNSQNTVNALSDASSGGVGYYFPGNEPAEEHVVATESEDGSSITMEPAHMNEDGELEPFDPGPGVGPGVDWGDWSLDVDLTVATWLTEEDINLTIPEGIVSVRFSPTALRINSGGLGRAYCYYSTGDSGYTRVPGNQESFLPGGGAYFDLGAVLNGDARPGMVLDAESEQFSITLQCWGWSGDDLVEIGSVSTSQPRELWLGQPLQMSGAGLAIDYALTWYGPELEPRSPRLEISEEVAEMPNLEDLEVETIGAVQTRFNDTLSAPSAVALDDSGISWVYSGTANIGGFRIYRNDYLIGTAPPNARGWRGDGLLLGECGDPTTFKVTSFAAGQESLPSSAVQEPSEACVAQITVTLDILQLRDLEDCDGDLCSSSAEGYGYFTVNDQAVNIGGSALFMGLSDGNAYTMGATMSSVGATNQITINLGEGDVLNFEFALFDHDTNSSDDLICALQDVLPSRDSEGWQGQSGRRITRTATGSEGTCGVTFQIDVAADSP